MILFYNQRYFMQNFRSFSQTIFEKLCTRLLSTALSSTMKVRLVDLFAEITADIEIIMQIFELGERILQTACNKRLTIALITSLTTLACSCRYGVPKLVCFLIFFQIVCSIKPKNKEYSNKFFLIRL